MSEILFSFSAFVSSKMMKERIIILKRRKKQLLWGCSGSLSREPVVPDERWESQDRKADIITTFF